MFDYDEISKDDLISYYTIDLSLCKCAITLEQEINMIPAKESINYPGKLYIKYQITEPGQEIFKSKEFNIDTLLVHIESFENIIPSN